ncbi:MAG TPA: HEAT repeat domain-containing protein [Planctomycetota bacterium]|jgi:HEAT repeat protein
MNHQEPRANSQELRATFLLALLLLAPAIFAADLTALVNTMPNADADGRYTGPDPVEARKVYDEFIAGGKDSIGALVGMLVEPGKGEDYKPRYVLHGMVTYVLRADAGDTRKTVCDSLRATLKNDIPKAVKGFVLQELKYLATAESIDDVAKFLSDDELCEPAAQTLLNIGGVGRASLPAENDATAVADCFRSVLGTSQGKNRLTVIQALGRLRDLKAVDAIKKLTADADPVTRLSACDAVANIGDASAIDDVQKAGDSAKDNDRVKITDALLTLASRLAEAGKKKEAEGIYAKLWDSRSAPEERQLRIAALQGLAETRGELSDVLAAMKTNDIQIRAVALRIAASMPGEAVTAKCVAALEKAPAADKPDLLSILGARGDPTAIPAVLAQLKDADAKVRSAAMQAASAIGGKGPAEALVAIIGAKDEKDRDAAVAALGAMKGKDVSAIVAAASLNADPVTRAALLSVLGARHADDQVDAVMAALGENDLNVRVAALLALGVIADDKQIPAVIKIAKETKDTRELGAAENALVATAARKGDTCANLSAAALADAAPANAAALLRVLGAAGTRKAMESAIAQTKSANAELKEMAVRVLSEWREKFAAGPLLEVAQASDNPTHQVLALRGVVRLVDKTDLKPEEKIKLLDGVLKAAKRPEEKKAALAGLGNVASADALPIIAPQLDDDSIKEEAAAAAISATKAMYDKKTTPNEAQREIIRDTMTKVAKSTTKETVKKDAEKYLSRAKN